MRQEHSSYKTDALCRLFGKSRQAYYERSDYVSDRAVEEDVVLSFIRKARKDFPRMASRKLLVYLKPSFDAMGISMTENGDPRENAIAERINGILKTEWLYGYKPDSWKSMVAYSGKIIDLYNNRRPHQSIGYMAPKVIHQTGMKTERKWKNYHLKKYDYFCEL
ncbi:MAG: integrase core domain-containing protein [Dysgonamonadaceae bacterium]|jgi:hypothetical protein|nr:integrase core domain-containing protein [Dysgonamonadaceae bacterium]